MPKAAQRVLLVLILVVVVSITGGLAWAQGAHATVSQGLQGPTLLPGCNSHVELSSSTRRAIGDTILTFQTTVLEDGKVGVVELLNHDGSYPGVEQAVQNALSRCRFEPGKLGGLPVTATMTIPVRFRDAMSVSSTHVAGASSARGMGATSQSAAEIASSRSGSQGRTRRGPAPDNASDTARSMPSTERAGPRDAYVIKGGPFYAVDMPVVNPTGKKAK